MDAPRLSSWTGFVAGPDAGYATPTLRYAKRTSQLLSSTSEFDPKAEALSNEPPRECLRRAHAAKSVVGLWLAKEFLFPAHRRP